MGLGPLCAIYQAHVNRYLLHRELADTSASRVWCFVGDGEFDEVESTGALGVAGREHLDNLIFVVNCNLQRLDGPVRGNGKIIQEAEATFRGAGWNVIKVIWGSKWDELLARDVDGVLLDKMNTTPDGEFQKYATESGAYIREHFFGPDPRLRSLVEHLSDEELQALPRGGHDYRKLYAAYKLATEQVGRAHGHPGQDHQGMDARPRDRGPQRHPPDQEDVQGPAARPPGPALPPRGDPRLGARRRAARPTTGRPRARPAYEYLTGAPKVLAGPVPARVVRVRPSRPRPASTVFADLLGGSGAQAVSTTMAFARLLRGLVRDPSIGRWWPPSSPTRPAPSASSRSSPSPRSTRPTASATRPVDADLILRYAESREGQILQEGITEAGAMAIVHRPGHGLCHLGPAHAPDLPLLFHVRLPAGRRPGLAARRHPGPGHPGRLHRRPDHLQGEGLQHDDGHSPLLASVNPAAHVYDPAFAYEIAVDHGGRRRQIVGPEPEDAFWYLTLYNENYLMPPLPAGPEGDGSATASSAASTASPARPSVGRAGPAAGPRARRRHAAASPARCGRRRWRPAPRWPPTGASPPTPGRSPRTPSSATTPSRPSAGTGSTPPRPAALALRHRGPGRRRPGPVVAVTDYLRAVPDQLARFVGRPFTSARHRRLRPLRHPRPPSAGSSRSTPPTSSSPSWPRWPAGRGQAGGGGRRHRRATASTPTRSIPGPSEPPAQPFQSNFSSAGGGPSSISGVRPWISRARSRNHCR